MTTARLPKKMTDRGLSAVKDRLGADGWRRLVAAVERSSAGDLDIRVADIQARFRVSKLQVQHIKHLIAAGFPDA